MVATEFKDFLQVYRDQTKDALRGENCPPDLCMDYFYNNLALLEVFMIYVVFRNWSQNLEKSPVVEEAAYFVIRLCDCEKRCTTHSLATPLLFSLFPSALPLPSLSP